MTYLGEPLARTSLSHLLYAHAGAGTGSSLSHPAIPVDNNTIERALRGVAIGRSHHYGSRSEPGTASSLSDYALLESKVAGLEPAAYLAEATRRAIATPGTVTRRAICSARSPTPHPSPPSIALAVSAMPGQCGQWGTREAVTEHRHARTGQPHAHEVP